MKIQFLNLCVGLILAFSAPLFAQDDGDSRFVRSYSYLQVYKNEEWGEWKEVETTFVFNINGGRNIKIYFGDGTEEMATKIGGVQKGKNKEGQEYQMVRILNNKGQEHELYLFDDRMYLFTKDGKTGIRFQ